MINKKLLFKHFLDMGVKLGNTTIENTIINSVDTYLNDCSEQIQTLKDDVDFKAVMYVI